MIGYHGCQVLYVFLLFTTNSMSVSLQRYPLSFELAHQASFYFVTEELEYRGEVHWPESGAYGFRKDSHPVENECVLIPLLCGCW
jgi:hypothetical protein